MDEWCCKCGGPLTRSKQYAVSQPTDSALCAPCWYNSQNACAPLLSLDDLDELQDLGQWGDQLVGRLIDWHSQIVPLVKLPNGGIFAQVVLTCRCGAQSEPFYAGSGLHNGAWPYIYDAEGKYLACIRDQEWRCEAHA